MPSFQFLTTLTVDAPSEAAAQTQADHAIEDADQYLSNDYKLERQSEAITVYEGVGKLAALPTSHVEQTQANYEKSLSDLSEPRYSVELTTEGWQVKDHKQGIILGSAYGSRHLAEEGCKALNDVPIRDKRREP